MIVYVTSLYAVRDSYLPQLYQHFQHLLTQISAPIFVFTDRELPFAVPSSCVILRRSLDSFQVYRTCMESGARLPKVRNAQKDTAEFMALMNTKVEMLWSAVPHFPKETTRAAWIDAGILKIVKNVERSKAAFAAHIHAAWPTRSVTIPGCWATVAPPSSDAICWRFCGGFFVAPVDLIEGFYKATGSVLEKWLRAGHLAWEVNIWAALEWEEAAWFTWWGADHNETMLEVPGFLSG
jgi:hypothetical protein